MTTVDLNADLGEWDGPGVSPVDERLLTLATSANVACGGHAGNAEVMLATVTRAKGLDVAIGAHPGYADREGFGRRELGLSPAEIAGQVAEQLSAMAACCRKAGARLRYVKPHGALYNRAVRDAEAARAIVGATREAGNLVLLCLPGSEMMKEAGRAGVRVAAEAFVDRGYRADGTLVPRGEPGALLDDVAAAVERALRLVTEGRLTPREGPDLTIHADSLCVHGDGPHAALLLEAVRTRFTQAGITPAPFAG
ncbi:MAG TPA: 5-oxoprolinase subunit PxpA [Gemmatimonadales bacterium]|nr:5-oxoprolinase subunit PxpA [Gemmatimonadales bacterium]